MENLYSIDNPLVTDEDIKDHSGIGAILHYPPDSILLFKHVKYQWWTIPVGKVQSGQSLQEALIQEIEEETGVVPVEFEEIGCYEKTYERGHGVSTTINMHIFDVTKHVGDFVNKEPEKHQ